MSLRKLTLALTPPFGRSTLRPAAAAASASRARTRLNTYTTIVILAGAGLAAVAGAQLTGVSPAPLAGLIALAVVASLFKLNLQLADGSATMTLGYAVGFAGLLLLGPHATAIAVSAGIWTQCSYRSGLTAPIDLRRRLFSVAAGIITVEASGWVFESLGALPGPPGASSLWVPLAGASLAYFLVNTALVAGAIALSTNQRVTEVWQRDFLLSAPSYFISAAAVGLGAMVASRYGLIGVALMTSPLVLTFFAYRAYLGRIAEEQEQLRIARDYTQNVIHSMNEMLLVVAPDGLITTTNAAARELLGYQHSDLVGRPLRHVLAAGSRSRCSSPARRWLAARERCAWRSTSVSANGTSRRGASARIVYSGSRQPWPVWPAKRRSCSATSRTQLACSPPQPAGCWCSRVPISGSSSARPPWSASTPTT
jgi:PAS domain S-box-containing protein